MPIPATNYYLFAFDYLVRITGWTVREKKGNAEHELSQKGATSIALRKLQGIRPVCHGAEIEVAPRTCGMKATHGKAWVGWDSEVNGKAGDQWLLGD